MYILFQAIHCLFLFIALVFLLIGIKKQAIYYVISSLWISLIALMIHFKYSGGQLLGSYFDYWNASIYTFNLLVLFFSFMQIISHLFIDSRLVNSISSLFKAVIVCGSLIILVNLWTNAYFIEHRLPGTPIIQIALSKKTNYCSYRYLFFKMTPQGSVAYLCPNHYGLIPSMGTLAVSPPYLMSQFQLRPEVKTM